MPHAYKRILIPILVSLLGPQVTYALPRPTSTPDADTRLFTEIGYFNSKANYDEGGGSFTTLPNGQYYKLIETHVGAEHWLSQGLSVVADAGFARAESYDGSFTRTNTEPTEFTAGLRYVLTRSAVVLIPESQIVYPFNRVDPGTDEVLTGEGAVKIFGGLWAETWFGSLNPYAQLGFLYQDGGRASHFLYLAGLGYAPGGFQIGAEIYGSMVAKEDESADARLERDAVTARVNGGSWKFYGVNPSVLGARVNAALPINDNWTLGAGFDQTLNGKAAAAGWTALARLEFTFDVREESVVDEVPRPRALEPEKRMLQKFEPEQPAYDPTLFDEPKQRHGKRPSKKAKPKKEDLDKSLQDVQKSLEQ